MVILHGSHFRSRLLEYKEKYSSNQQLLPAIPSTSRMAASTSSDNSNEAYEIWRFSPDDVFSCTIDGFLAQLCDMCTLFEAAVSFQSLEKIEFGGLRGKQLNERVRQVSYSVSILKCYG